MSVCPCEECQATPPHVQAETEARWSAWKAAVNAGTDRSKAYDRWLHPATRVAAEYVAGAR